MNNFWNTLEINIIFIFIISSKENRYYNTKNLINSNFLFQQQILFISILIFSIDI